MVGEFKNDGPYPTRQKEGNEVRGERIEITKQEVKERIREVLRGCPNGLDGQSLQAACSLLGEIEIMQATLRLLQRGKITGYVDEDGEVHVRARRSAEGK